MNVLTKTSATPQLTSSQFRFFIVALLTLVLSALIAPSTLAQGFGRSKITTTLSVKTPPRIYLVGTDIQIKISSKANINPRALQRLQDRLEITLPKYDWRLNVVSKSPETLLTCTVSQFSTVSRPEVRTRQVYKEIGSHVVYDAAGVSQTVQDYGYVQERYTATALTGRATIDYEITDLATGNLLDEDVLTINFNQSYETNPPDVQVAVISTIDKVVEAIATRFLPTFSSIVVNLPKGDLEEIGYLLKDGMWNSTISRLNAMRPFKKAEDDAYRLYALGIAYEGLAYESPDLASTKMYLEQAAGYHNSASQQNFSAPDFQDAAVRVSRILPAYKDLESSINAYEQMRNRKGLKVIETAKIHQYFGTTHVLTNDLIIGWAKSGIKENEILKRIENLRVKYFDLSASAIAELTQNGVQPGVIDAMRRAMIPKQSAQRSKRQAFGMVVSYALAFYPYLFLF
jgi:hypothetical protein